MWAAYYGYTQLAIMKIQIENKVVKPTNVEKSVSSNN